MEETIKTARFAHRTVTAICFAFLLFAIGPDESAPYANAIVDLEVLDRAAAQFDDFNREMLTSLEEDANSKINFELYRVKDEFDFAPNTMPTNTVSVHRFFKFEPAPVDGTCSEVLAYLRTNPMAKAFEFDRRPNSQDKKQGQDGVEVPPVPDCSDDQLRVPEDAESDAPPVAAENAEQGGPEDLSPAIGPFTIRRLLEDDTTNPIFIADILAVNGSGMSYALEGSFDEVPQSDYLSYLDRNGFASTRDAAFDVSSEHSLSGITTVWNEVRGRTIEDSFVYLSSKMQEKSRTMSLLGVSVESATVILIAPVVLVTTILYLLVHLRFLNHLKKNGGQLPSFPWFALFPGGLAGAIAYASILVLPSFSMFLLSQRALGATFSVVGCVTTLFILSTSGITSWELWWLRR